MAKEEAKKAKVKRPSALKRDIQSEKKRLLNKAFRARVRTAVRALESSLNGKDEAQVKNALSEVFSLMDKGVKRGVYKKNTANRTKSRLTARAFAKKAA